MSTIDIVRAAVEKNAVRVKELFDTAVSDRVFDRVDQMKPQVAANLFNTTPPSNTKED